MYYMGSKAFMKDDVLQIIYDARDILNINRYYELFMGGCNIIKEVEIKNKHGNDNNKYLVSFLEYIRDKGLEDLPNVISRDTWYNVKYNTEDFPDWYVFYVLNFGSFNCSWGHGYGGEIEDKDGNIFNKIMSAKKNLIKDENKLNTFSISNLDYREVKIESPSIIYLDPPYKNTHGYLGGNKFDHKAFYDYAIELSKENFVLVSEYFMKKPFKAVK